MTEYGEMKIEFPEIGRHLVVTVITIEEATMFKEGLESGDFKVRIFVQEKREL